MSLQIMDMLINGENSLFNNITGITDYYNYLRTNVSQYLFTDESSLL